MYFDGHLLCQILEGLARECVSTGTLDSTGSFDSDAMLRVEQGLSAYLRKIRVGCTSGSGGFWSHVGGRIGLQDSVMMKGPLYLQLSSLPGV